MSRDKWLAAAGGVAILAGAAAGLGGGAKSLPEAPPQAQSGYVNSSACAGCHAEIFKSYRLTGMGRSLYRPAPEKKVEDFKTHNTLYNRASDRYYTMLERDGKWYERRHQLGFDGKETNVVEKQIDY